MWFGSRHQLMLLHECRNRLDRRPLRRVLRRRIDNQAYRPRRCSGENLLGPDMSCIVTERSLYETQDDFMRQVSWSRTWRIVRRTHRVDLRIRTRVTPWDTQSLTVPTTTTTTAEEAKLIYGSSLVGDARRLWARLDDWAGEYGRTFAMARSGVRGTCAGGSSPGRMRAAWIVLRRLPSRGHLQGGASDRFSWGRTR